VKVTEAGVDFDGVLYFRFLFVLFYFIILFSGVD